MLRKQEMEDRDKMVPQRRRSRVQESRRDKGDMEPIRIIDRTRRKTNHNRVESRLQIDDLGRGKTSSQNFSESRNLNLSRGNKITDLIHHQNISENSDPRLKSFINSERDRKAKKDLSMNERRKDKLVTEVRTCASQKMNKQRSDVSFRETRGEERGVRELSVGRDSLCDRFIRLTRKPNKKLVETRTSFDNKNNVVLSHKAGDKNATGKMPSKNSRRVTQHLEVKNNVKKCQEESILDIKSLERSTDYVAPNSEMNGRYLKPEKQQLVEEWSDSVIKWNKLREEERNKLETSNDLKSSDVQLTKIRKRTNLSAVRAENSAANRSRTVIKPKDDIGDSPKRLRESNNRRLSKGKNRIETSTSLGSMTIKIVKEIVETLEENHTWITEGRSKEDAKRKRNVADEESTGEDEINSTSESKIEIQELIPNTTSGDSSNITCESSERKNTHVVKSHAGRKERERVNKNGRDIEEEARHNGGKMKSRTHSNHRVYSRNLPDAERKCMDQIKDSEVKSKSNSETISSKIDDPPENHNADMPVRNVPRSKVRSKFIERKVPKQVTDSRIQKQMNTSKKAEDKYRRGESRTKNRLNKSGSKNKSKNSIEPVGDSEETNIKVPVYHTKECLEKYRIHNDRQKKATKDKSWSLLNMFEKCLKLFKTSPEMEEVPASSQSRQSHSLSRKKESTLSSGEKEHSSSRPKECIRSSKKEVRSDSGPRKRTRSSEEKIRSDSRPKGRTRSFEENIRSHSRPKGRTRSSEEKIQYHSSTKHMSSSKENAIRTEMSNRRRRSESMHLEKKAKISSKSSPQLLKSDDNNVEMDKGNTRQDRSNASRLKVDEHSGKVLKLLFDNDLEMISSQSTINDEKNNLDSLLNEPAFKDEVKTLIQRFIRNKNEQTRMDSVSESEEKDTSESGLERRRFKSQNTLSEADMKTESSLKLHCENVSNSEKTSMDSTTKQVGTLLSQLDSDLNSIRIDKVALVRDLMLKNIQNTNTKIDDILQKLSSSTTTPRKLLEHVCPTGLDASILKLNEILLLLEYNEWNIRHSITKSSETPSISSFKDADELKETLEKHTITLPPKPFNRVSKAPHLSVILSEDTVTSLGKSDVTEVRIKSPRPCDKKTEDTVTSLGKSDVTEARIKSPRPCDNKTEDTVTLLDKSSVTEVRTKSPIPCDNKTEDIRTLLDKSDVTEARMKSPRPCDEETETSLKKNDITDVRMKPPRPCDEETETSLKKNDITDVRMKPRPCDKNIEDTVSLMDKSDVTRKRKAPRPCENKSAIVEDKVGVVSTDDSELDIVMPHHITCRHSRSTSEWNDFISSAQTLKNNLVRLMECVNEAMVDKEVEHETENDREKLNARVIQIRPLKKCKLSRHSKKNRRKGKSTRSDKLQNVTAKAKHREENVEKSLGGKVQKVSSTSPKSPCIKNRSQPKSILKPKVEREDIHDNEEEPECIDQKQAPEAEATSETETTYIKFSDMFVKVSSNAAPKFSKDQGKVDDICNVKCPKLKPNKQITEKIYTENQDGICSMLMKNGVRNNVHHKKWSKDMYMGDELTDDDFLEQEEIIQVHDMAIMSCYQDKDTVIECDESVPVCEDPVGTDDDTPFRYLKRSTIIKLMVALEEELSACERKRNKIGRCEQSKLLSRRDEKVHGNPDPDAEELMLGFDRCNDALYGGENTINDPSFRGDVRTDVSESCINFIQNSINEKVDQKELHKRLENKVDQSQEVMPNQIERHTELDENDNNVENISFRLEEKYVPENVVGSNDEGDHQSKKFVKGILSLPIEGIFSRADRSKSREIICGENLNQNTNKGGKMVDKHTTICDFRSDCSVVRKSPRTIMKPIKKRRSILLKKKRGSGTMSDLLNEKKIRAKEIALLITSSLHGGVSGEKLQTTELSSNDIRENTTNSDLQSSETMTDLDTKSYSILTEKHVKFMEPTNLDEDSGSDDTEIENKGHEESEQFAATTTNTNRTGWGNVGKPMRTDSEKFNPTQIKDQNDIDPASVSKMTHLVFKTLIPHCRTSSEQNRKFPSNGLSSIDNKIKKRKQFNTLRCDWMKNPRNAVLLNSALDTVMDESVNEDGDMDNVEQTPPSMMRRNGYDGQVLQSDVREISSGGNVTKKFAQGPVVWRNVNVKSDQKDGSATENSEKERQNLIPKVIRSREILTNCKPSLAMSCHLRNCDRKNTHNSSVLDMMIDKFEKEDSDMDNGEETSSPTAKRLDYAGKASQLSERKTADKGNSTKKYVQESVIWRSDEEERETKDERNNSNARIIKSIEIPMNCEPSLEMVCPTRRGILKTTRNNEMQQRTEIVKHQAESVEKSTKVKFSRDHDTFKTIMNRDENIMGKNRTHMEENGDEKMRERRRHQ